MSTGDYMVMGEIILMNIEGPLYDNVDELGLSIRTYNCLKHAGIYTVEDLCNRTVEDMMKIRNLGRRSLEEILTGLKANGMSLKNPDDE